MPRPLELTYPRVECFQPQAGFWDRIQRAQRVAPASCERLRIGQMGLRERFSAGDCDRCQGTPGYWFIVRFNGPVRLWRGEAWMDAAAGTTVLWAPGQRHRYGVGPGGAIDHAYVFASGRRIAALIGTLKLGADQPLAGVASEPFSAHLHALIQESLRHQPDELILESTLANLLMTIARDTKHPVRDDERMLLVRRLLETGVSRQHSLASLAASVHLSPTYLSARFSRMTGQSPIAYLIDLRLRQARELLRSTDLQIKAVASQVGYEDPYFFSRLFRRKVGVSPRAYRRQKTT
jgi:AraC family transcriptional regulator of arabinose operon